ncbi:DNA polymerase/3'-5' exonuclease PolX [Bacillus sp. DJP31]|uniref:DNA polymerase/3'-5' exonuclease PolX n=1 Tax=Bacillus sp. DJP31 TaxID=3409789 RepID=UPI003BB7206D
MNKKDVTQLLEMIAIYMELKGENAFKTAAFRKAAISIEQDERPITEIDDITALPGVGKGTAAVIEEYLQTGHSNVLEELQAQVPPGLIPLLKLPGLGGKKIAKLYKELGIIDINGLKESCEEQKIRGLAGFGEKSEQKILQAIQEVGNRPDRLPIAFMLPIAQEIESNLCGMTEIVSFSRAGSLRRVRETIKDLDFIISTYNAIAVKEQLLRINKVKDVIASGETKVSLVLDYEYEVSVDFRLVKPKEFATTLHHFTGSKDHNVKMRQVAKERGLKISEYGVENIENQEVTTFETEEAFYQYFGLTYIPPELRVGDKEIEIFGAQVPLVKIEDIKGDLHMHSTWSDGAHTIEQMAEACIARGYSYMAITDHSKYLRVANGLTVERLKRQHEEIKRLNQKYKNFTILTGVEMDILPDGSLDYDDELLEEMDIVIASIHSSFSQDQKTIMKRLKNALTNAHVDIIAHPTGRLIGRREGYDVDMDMLIELARETNTALELNANPNRLDLSSIYIQKAQDAGVKVIINTDAHHIDQLGYMDLGVSVAKKGWIRKENVVNAWSLEQLKAFLHRHQ